MDVKSLIESKFLNEEVFNASLVKEIVILDEGEIADAKNIKQESYKSLTLKVELGSKQYFYKPNTKSIKTLTALFGSSDTKLWVGKPIVMTTMLVQGGKVAVVPFKLKE